jgi:hypothetical protein
MMCADDLAFQERPNAVNRLRVDVITNVLPLRVIDVSFLNSDMRKAASPSNMT